MRKKQFCKVPGEGALQAEVATYAKPEAGKEGKSRNQVKSSVAEMQWVRVRMEKDEVEVRTGQMV